MSCNYNAGGVNYYRDFESKLFYTGRDCIDRPVILSRVVIVWRQLAQFFLDNFHPYPLFEKIRHN